MKRFVLKTIVSTLVVLFAPIYVHAGFFGANSWRANLNGDALVKEPGKHSFDNISSLKLPPSRKQYREGEILVKFKATATEQSKKTLHKKYGSEKIKEFKSLGIHHVKLRKSLSVEEAIKLYKKEPEVEYAEPNYIVKTRAMPNDTYFNQLWGLYNTGQTGGTAGADIKAPAAWDKTTGSGDVTVAVIDTGVDYTHPDLAPNIWVNCNEISGNGVDDDNNGYTDDIHGIDAFNHDTDPMDDVGHGTHVAGIIGASGNNDTGVVGVNWNVKILACKFMGADGGDISGAIECLQYVKALKDRPVNPVNIVATNNSWGYGCYSWDGNCFSQSLYDAISVQQDILFIAAAGNDGKDIDASKAYPASYNLPNVIAVAATDANDSMASFSNYGSRSVHVGAPGVDILSTVPGSYAVYSGTSMATPYVSGLAALLKAQYPALGAQGLKNLILTGGDPVPSLTDTTMTGKRINADRSLTCVNIPQFSPIQYPASLAVGVPVTLSVLSINCAQPVGSVTVTTSGGEVITLHDDGVDGDLAANDGIFTGTWTPSRGDAERLVFSSPAGTASVVIPRFNFVTTTASLSQGLLNTSFSQTLAASGGLVPYIWTLIDGTLPPGLTLNSATGEIAGTPTVAGEFGFTVQATEGFHTSLTRQLSIIIRSVDFTPSWTQILDASGGAFDFANAIVSDKGGNVYVTGYSNGNMLTVKYDPQGNLLWSKSFGAMGSGIALDIWGNVYVTGSMAPTGFTRTDSFIIKYDPTGNVLWSKTFSYMDLFYLEFHGMDITLDKSGNVYMAGIVGAYGNYYKFSLMKLDQSGNQVWWKTYSRATNDSAEGIATDGNGNIYVTGFSDYQCLTVKYDASGNLLWSKTFAAGENTVGNALATDGNGNVYVTGEFDNNDVERFFIVKYDPAGNVIWSKTRDQSNYGERYGKRLAVDGNNNVYAVGELDNGSGYDLFFIIYDPSGSVIGYQKYNGSTWQSGYGIAVDDDAGNVYVTGYALNDPFWNDFNFLTMRYEKSDFHVSSPQLLPPGKLNAPYSQTLIVKGGVSPYAWSVTAGALPPGLTLNPSTGEISGTPTTAGKFDFTVRIGSNGQTATKAVTIAVMNIATTAFPQAPVDMAYSQVLQGEGGLPPYRWSITSGVFPPGLSLNGVTGEISGIPTGGAHFDFTIQLADSLGDTVTEPLSITVVCLPLVINTSALPAGRSTVYYSQTLSASGGKQPYVWSVSAGAVPPGLTLAGPTGTISGVPTTEGLFTFTVQVNDAYANTASKDLSIGVANAPLSIATWWLTTGEVGTAYSQTVAATGGVRPYNWTLTAGALPDGLVLDPATGRISGTPAAGGMYDFTLRVTDSTSTSLSMSFSVVVAAWLTSYPHAGTDSATSIAVDAAGNAYVTGSFHAVNNDYMTLKYDPAGNLLWQKLYDTGSDDIARKIAVDRNNNVYVTGDGSNTGYYLTMKYDQSGNQLWAKTYNPPNSGYKESTAVAVDASGNVYVTGSFYNQTTSRSEYLTIKYDPLGNMLWSRTADGWGQDIVIDRSGNVYVSGLVQPTSQSNNCVTIKYDPSGTVLWTQTADFRPSAMVIDGYDNIYVAGDKTIVKYDSAGTLKWSKNYIINIGSIAIDGRGNIHALQSVSGSTAFSMIRCDSTGSVFRTTNFNMTSPVIPAGIAVDSTGDTVYLTGSLLNVSDYDYFTMKYGDGVRIATPAFPAAYINSTYSQTLAASGGTPPYVWTVVSGKLPSGLVLNGVTGAITGTSTATGASSFTIQVADSYGAKTTKSFSIFVTYLSPAVSFTGAPLTGQAPLYVTFTDNTSNSPTGWSWAFGDGGASRQQNPAHTYTTPGTYSVALAATNMGGSNTMTRTNYITVLACLNAPVMISGATFGDLQTAYNQAADNGLIQAQAMDFANDLVLARDIHVTLKGGYDCGYSSNPAATGLLGKLRVTNGTVKVEKLRFM